MYSSFKKHQLITESWRRFLLKESSSETDSIDDIISSTHASGRPISPIFDPIIDEEDEQSENSPLDLISLLTPKFLGEFVRNAPTKKMPFDPRKNISFSNNFSDVTKILPDSRLPMIDRIMKIVVYNSIILFTGGDVAMVRNPELFDPTKSDKKVFTVPFSDLNYILKPSKKMFEIANHIMTTLSTMETTTPVRKIYRGLQLPMEVFKGLQEGDIFNNRGCSSWTTATSIATTFAERSVLHPEDGENEEEEEQNTDTANILFQIESPTHGSDITRFSVYPKEKEFVLGRPVQITAINTIIPHESWRKDLQIVRCEIK